MKNIDPEMVVKYLNELLEADPAAISSLVFNRVVCNENLENHPTCQIQIDPVTGKAEVGLLGVINGLVGKDEKSGSGYIAAEIDEEDNLVKFVVLNFD